MCTSECKKELKVSLRRKIEVGQKRINCKTKNKVTESQKKKKKGCNLLEPFFAFISTFRQTLKN